MPIAVEIVSKERKVFEELEADMVVVPASEGIMGVLPHHAPVLTTLGYGELIVRKGPAEERFAIYGGVVDVRPTKVTILAELAESSFELDIEAIDRAREEAARMMAEGQAGLSEAARQQINMAMRRAELAHKIASRAQSRPGIRIVEQE
ncbi:MAG: ATP synthase F1 subunit epsilon [Chloroflexi bacterium]|nr:ATP synthase F1 subunit epsilon [Chloroflexota bacterium]